MKHYINLKISPEYALLISGKWGTGKTFFINNYLEKERHEEKKFIKISLFGIKSVDEIHKQIIFQLIGTEEGSLSNSLIKIGSSILDSFGKKINLGIHDIPIEQVLKTLTKKLDKEIIFIFDDLERITVNIPEILGYINILVERLQLKTILLANESELDQKDQYKEFKEKIIGKTFLLKQDFNTSFDAFIQLTNLSKTVIIDNKITIENIFNTADYHNLRHVRQSILDFEHFFENIEEKFYSNKELMQELIEIFFALSIEIKNGKFDIQDVKDLQLVESFEYYMEKADAEEQKEVFTRKPLDLFLEKYSLTNREGLLLTEKMWIELFTFGILKQSEITESFENSKYFVIESPKEWIPLWHYHELEDESFKEKLEEVANKFNNNEYKEHKVFMHVVGILLRLSKIKLYDKSSQEIIDRAKSNIDNNLEILEKNIDLEESAFGLGYMEEETDEFIEVKDYLLDKTYEAIHRSLEDLGTELIEFLNNNDYENFKYMLSFDSLVNKLYELPVFSKIDSNTFFNAILTTKHSTLRRILPTIEKRYSQESINVSLIDELEFWQEFEKCLDEEIPKREKTVKGIWLNILKDRVIRGRIIDKLQKVKDNNAEELIKNPQADS
jgi:hypothetical protein